MATALAGGLFFGGLVLGAVLGITLDRNGLFDPSALGPAQLAALAPAAGPEAVEPDAADSPRADRIEDALPAPEITLEAMPAPRYPARPLPPETGHHALDGAIGTDELDAERDTATPKRGAPLAATPADADWTIPAALRRRAPDTLDANGVPVVYEEPVPLSDLLPPPSEREFDSFLENSGLTLQDDAATPGERPLAWQANAVPVGDTGGRPMIALVLDDLGLNRPNSRRAAALPGPLTLAFMTYAEKIDGMLETARESGHELLVHMPMQPRDSSYNPGPNALIVGLDEEELARRIDWGLSRFEGFVGVNNHMGSLFTTSLPGMGQVLAELKKRGLLYLDSKTAGASVGSGLALRLGVPYADRDIFIDNERGDKAAIRRQLKALEATAKRRGYAVGIGHPHSTTLDVLSEWLADVEARGFALVPISAVVKRRIEIARSADRAG